MDIPKELNNEIWDYCRINNITGIDDFIVRLIRQGFTIEKYGATPMTKQKIIEKIVEVPIEKIIEKKVYISDDAEVLKLTQKITELTDELTQVTLKLENEKKNKRDIYGEG